MADFGSIIKRVGSVSKSLGKMETIRYHEPKSALPNGIHGALTALTVGPFSLHSGLAATSAKLTLQLAIYKNMLSQPEDNIDSEMLAVLDRLYSAYSGKFTLEGNVAFIDLLGQTGEVMQGTFGYVEIDKKMYRVATLVLPVIVNNCWTQEA